MFHKLRSKLLSFHNTVTLIGLNINDCCVRIMDVHNYNKMNTRLNSTGCTCVNIQLHIVHTVQDN